MNKDYKTKEPNGPSNIPEEVVDITNDPGIAGG